MTVALAEQGANVTSLDVHREAILTAKLRCAIHNVENVSFMEANATDIREIFRGTKAFDLILFYAALEHMTLDERRLALSGAMQILPNGKYMCIAATPNRLWFHDSHTSFLPFFHWLPDELAFEYSACSPRFPFNNRYRELDKASMLSFLREGRGVSFHELDLYFGLDQTYKVVSDLSQFLSYRNPAKLLKRIVRGDGKRERLLRSYAPQRARAFFREYLELVLQKM
jgi:S-adenosylmethionine-dependent methyltransferase